MSNLTIPNGKVQPGSLNNGDSSANSELNNKANKATIAQTRVTIISLVVSLVALALACASLASVHENNVDSLKHETSMSLYGDYIDLSQLLEEAQELTSSTTGEEGSAGIDEERVRELARNIIVDLQAGFRLGDEYCQKLLDKIMEPETNAITDSKTDPTNYAWMNQSLAEDLISCCNSLDPGKKYYEY